METETVSNRFTSVSGCYTTNNALMLLQYVLLLSHCHMFCNQDTRCKSFFYNRPLQTCILHDVIYLSQMDLIQQADWTYFTIFSGFECPGNKEYIQSRHLGMCVKIYTSPFSTKGNAEKHCSDDNAALVKLDTAGKQNFIVETLKLSSDHNYRDFHIGISLSVNINNDVHDSKWVWPDNTEVVYDSFHPGETIANNEVCAEINPSMHFNWNVIPCSELGGYICERN